MKPTSEMFEDLINTLAEVVAVQFEIVIHIDQHLNISICEQYEPSSASTSKMGNWIALWENILLFMIDVPRISYY